MKEDKLNDLAIFLDIQIKKLENIKNKFKRYEDKNLTIKPKKP